MEKDLIAATKAVAGVMQNRLGHTVNYREIAEAAMRALIAAGWKNAQDDNFLSPEAAFFATEDEASVVIRGGTLSLWEARTLGLHLMEYALGQMQENKKTAPAE